MLRAAERDVCVLLSRVQTSSLSAFSTGYKRRNITEGNKERKDVKGMKDMREKVQEKVQKLSFCAHLGK